MMKDDADQELYWDIKKRLLRRSNLIMSGLSLAEQQKAYKQMVEMEKDLNAQWEE